jgi:DNA-binding NarL/FixJ family response regulator
MRAKRVLIVASHSLLADGVANRLRLCPEQVEICRLSPGDEDLPERVTETGPSAISIDQRDPAIGTSLSLSTILDSLPGVQVLLLDPQDAQVQVVSSRTQGPIEMEDRFELISNSA